MKRFATALLIALSLAGPVGAFSMEVVMPNLTFPDSTTTTSTQSCVPTPALPCK